jgi:diguanylate cyclase (GGDEF)-like protein/PAS domain S-box-containing protein
MFRLPLVVRSSLALVSLTVSILFAALAVGLVPDRHQAILLGRKNLCEAVAIECAWGIQQKNLNVTQGVLDKVLKRNPDMLSIGIRTAKGELLVEAGDHRRLWKEKPAGPSIDTHMEVPIILGSREETSAAAARKPWGKVEYRYLPPAPTGLGASLVASPTIRLMTFMAVCAFLSFTIYLGAIIRRAAQSQASVVPRRVRATIDTLAEGVVILDKDQRIAMANEAFARLTGHTPEELQGRGVAEFAWLHAQAKHEGEAYPWNQAIEGRTQTGALLALQTDGPRPRVLSVNSAPILADDGTRRGVLATFDDMTLIEKKNTHLRKLLQKLMKSRADIRRQNQELKSLATRDALTKCLNRRSFFTHFEGHLAAAGRYDYPLSCLMVDVDRFKSINDTHGHGVGDQVLQRVAELLRSMVRKSDLLCRYGGEEFCILLPHVDLDEAVQAAERFRAGLEAQPCCNITVTASFGVSALSLGAHEPRELLDQADQALYAAKRAGRNRVVSWDRVPEATPAEEARRGHAAPPDVEREVPLPFHAVTALVSALAYRHPDTAEHSRRVADLCVAAAEGLLSRGECYVLEVAGMLHDIGKLGVPDAILMKPGPLTEVEWKVIRTHERIGQEIIAASFTSEELAAITRHHHAWYGGSPNDPDAVKGPDIPVGARLLALADAYDAMVSDRVYRQGKSQEEAFAELRRGAGTQFDPGLVERFIATVLARDDSRTPPEFTLTKQTALRIGLQIEKLSHALDAQDTVTLAAMAGRLHATASEYGIEPIAAAAGRLEKTARAGGDREELIALTIELLDLCRATYRSYLPSGGDDADWLAKTGSELLPA